MPPRTFRLLLVTRGLFSLIKGDIGGMSSCGTCAASELSGLDAICVSRSRLAVAGPLYELRAVIGLRGERGGLRTGVCAGDLDMVDWHDWPRGNAA